MSAFAQTLVAKPIRMNERRDQQMAARAACANKLDKGREMVPSQMQITADRLPPDAAKK